jgi:hypothetical protein
MVFTEDDRIIFGISVVDSNVSDDFIGGDKANLDLAE